jgi:hypothetical protein
VARPLRVTEAVVISLLLAISQSLVIAHAINDPSVQANIHATHIASKFASEINPGKYHQYPNAKKHYYLIGSIDLGSEQTAPSLPIVANRAGIIQQVPTMTVPATNGEIETSSLFSNGTALAVTDIYDIFNILNNRTKAIQPVANGNASLVTNTYDKFNIIDNQTRAIQPFANGNAPVVTDNYDIFNILNNRTKAIQPVANGNLKKKIVEEGSQFPVSSQITVGNQGNQVGNQGNQVGNQGNQVGNQGNQVGNQGNQVGNQGNQGGSQGNQGGLDPGNGDIVVLQ